MSTDSNRLNILYEIYSKTNKPLPDKTLREIDKFFKTELKPRLVDKKHYRETIESNNTKTLTLVPSALSEDDLISLLGILIYS